MMSQKDAEIKKISSDIENHESLLDVMAKYEKGDIPMHVVNFGSSMGTTTNGWG